MGEQLMAGYYVKDVAELMQIKASKQKLLGHLKEDLAYYQAKHQKHQGEYEKSGEWGWENAGFDSMCIANIKRTINEVKNEIKGINDYLKSAA